MRAVGLVALAAVAVVAANSLYVVGQDREAVVLRLGAPVAVVNPPGRDQAGLWLKWPFADRIVAFDRRDQPVAIERDEVATANQARVTVDAYARYRVVDPLQAYRRLGDTEAVASALRTRLAAALRDALGAASDHDIVTGRDQVPMVAARLALAKGVNAARLGIEVTEVGLSRADPAPSAATGIYRRMQGVLEDRADQARAQAEQQKRQLMAEADKQAAIIRATADAQAEQIRGQGEAQRLAILNAAYGRDPEFARFLRSMQAYRQALAQGDTTLVLTQDSPFLHQLIAGPQAPKAR